MKKTIAMLSALAISASLVMPFTAVAADAGQLTRLTSDDLTNDFESVVKALGLKENATPPSTITGEAAADERAYLIYGYSSTTFLVAGYIRGEVYTNVEEGISTVRSHIGYGNNYYYYSATSATDENANQVTKVEYDTVKDYTVEQMVAFLNVSADGTAPETITGVDGINEPVYVPYGYDDNGFKLAPYENGVHNSERDNPNGTLDDLKMFAMYGRLYMLGTSGNTITQDSNPKSANTNVKYSIDPAYTITIPAAVELDDTDVQATFKVEGAESGKSPLLHKDDKIVVKLTEARNRPQGENFYVTTPHEKGKATYHVKNAEDTQIGLGGTIATFEYQPDKNTDYWTKKATFTKPSGATYAGVYTDTLTFNISVKNPHRDDTAPDFGD